MLPQLLHQCSIIITFSIHSWVVRGGPRYGGGNSISESNFTGCYAITWNGPAIFMFSVRPFTSNADWLLQLTEFHSLGVNRNLQISFLRLWADFSLPGNTSKLKYEWILLNRRSNASKRMLCNKNNNNKNRQWRITV